MTLLVVGVFFSLLCAGAALFFRSRRRPKTIAFFHPYCNAAGGGERVLWCAIKAMRERFKDEEFQFCVYTGDTDATPADILAKAHKCFGVSLDPEELQFVYVRNRWLLEARYYPFFTLLLQSVGSVLAVLEALWKLTPSILVDTTGAAFTYPLFRWFGGAKVVCYVHYPTITKGARIQPLLAAWIRLFDHPWLLLAPASFEIDPPKDQKLPQDSAAQADKENATEDSHSSRRKSGRNRRSTAKQKPNTPTLSVEVDYAEMRATIVRQRLFPVYVPEFSTFRGAFLRRVLVDGPGFAEVYRKAVHISGWDLPMVLIRCLFYWTARGHPTAVCFPRAKAQIPALKDDQKVTFKRLATKLASVDMLHLIDGNAYADWLKDYVANAGGLLVTHTGAWLRAADASRQPPPTHLVTPFFHPDGAEVFFPETNPCGADQPPLSELALFKADLFAKEQVHLSEADFDAWTARQLRFGQQVLRLKFLYDLLPADARHAERAVLKELVKLVPK